MATFEDIIKADQRERLQNILLSFKETDEELVKGLTEDDFNTKYPKEEYQIYSEQAINNFKKGLEAEIIKNPNNKGELLEKAQHDLSELSKKMILGTPNRFVFVKKLDNDIEKGNRANVGEIHEWNGKKYKKQPNGKWLEVSEHGMTKKEHKFESDLHDEKSKDSGFNSEHQEESKDKSAYHKTISYKLSDKEHSDEEVGLGQSKKFKEPAHNYMEGKKVKKEDEKFTEAEKKYLKL